MAAGRWGRYIGAAILVAALAGCGGGDLVAGAHRAQLGVERVRVHRIERPE